MQRRQFFGKLGLGSAVAMASTPVLGGSLTSPNDQELQHAHGDDPGPLSGVLSNATVSFGAWQSKNDAADPPQNTELDRYPNVSPAARNSHHLTPFQAVIWAGGTVNFVISGLHQVIVYAPGKTPEGVDETLTRPTTGTPAGLALINDPVGRVYAGWIQACTLGTGSKWWSFRLGGFIS